MQSPKGPHKPLRPTDSPGRANPAGPGGSPQKDPKGPTNLSTPPTRPAGQTQQVRAAARKNPKGLTSLSTQPTRPAGHAQQVRAAARKRPKGPNQPFRPTDSPGRARLAEFRRPQPAEKISIIFSPGMYRGKYSSHPESAGSAGAVRGAAPNFGRGLPPSRQLDTPVLCPPERRQTPGAPPKIPHSTLFSASTISKSRSFLRAVRFTAKEKTTVSTAAHR